MTNRASAVWTGFWAGVLWIVSGAAWAADTVLSLIVSDPEEIHVRGPWLFGGGSWYAGGRFGRTYLVTPRAGGCRVTQHARSGKCTRARDARSVREGKRLAELWEE